MKGDDYLDKLLRGHKPQPRPRMAPKVAVIETEDEQPSEGTRWLATDKFRYLPPKAAFKILDFSPAAVDTFTSADQAREVLRSADFGAQLIQQRRGSVMHVDADVVSDLMASDLPSEAEDLRGLTFPSDSVEIHLHSADYNFPILLWYRTPEEERFTEFMKAVNMPQEDRAYALGGEGSNYDLSDKLTFLLSIARESKPAGVGRSFPYLRVEHTLDQLQKSYEDAAAEGGVADDRPAGFLEMCRLLLKLILFINSEGHAPEKGKPVVTKARVAGKRKLQKRLTPVWNVAYLPAQRVERAKENEEAKKKKKFNGRRGHWRTFRAARYREKVGTRIFIDPIPGPDGTVPRTRFIVRKPPKK